MEYAVYKMIGSESVYMFAVEEKDVYFILGILKERYPNERFTAVAK